MLGYHKCINIERSSLIEIDKMYNCKLNEYVCKFCEIDYIVQLTCFLGCDLKYFFYHVTYSVDGCRSGYFGHRCMNKCKYPNYGKGCQSNCGCLEENCNFINGCYVPESNKH